MKASEYYKTKPVNVVNQAWNADGSVDIKIYVAGWKKTCTFKVKDFGKSTESILVDEEVTEG